MRVLEQTTLDRDDVEEEEEEKEQTFFQWALGNDNYTYIFGETLLGGGVGFSPTLHILGLFVVGLVALCVIINTNYRVVSLLTYLLVCILHNVFALSK